MTTSPRSYDRPRIGIVLSGWPRVSETFALNELLALEDAGMLGAVVATKGGDDALVQPNVARLRTPVRILDAGDAEQQGRQLAEVASGRVDAFHAYFAHHPVAVAEVAAARLSVPFGFSAHALDVRKVAADELARRAAAAACVVACNRDTVEALTGVGAGVRHLAHGVDLAHFTPEPFPTDTAGFHVVAIGRFVEKKGFPFLIAALAGAGDRTRLTLVGDGPDRPVLEALVDQYGVADRVVFAGRRTHAELPALMASAHAVAVPSIVDRAGDRDGLPNVVLEAMACGRPVIASDVAAISTAVRPDVSGILVPSGDADALAVAIRSLAADPQRCRRLGAGARTLVTDEFDLTTCTRRFVRTLEAAYG